jgi:amidophosphoribosyltransferase
MNEVLDMYPREECGVAAVYWLPNGRPSSLYASLGVPAATRLLPRMLLDVQNRGQLAAGISTFSPDRRQLLLTYKAVGTVSEAFVLNNPDGAERLMRTLDGLAGIGHVRYATCGQEDCSFAQPFERPHIKRYKWFSFAFNGQLANYKQLEAEILTDPNNYLARQTDTEVILHCISYVLSRADRVPLRAIAEEFAKRFDGAYSLVYLDAAGRMMVIRDPLGFKPLCYAYDGELFAAASESVALLNLGFSPDSIFSLEPGYGVFIENGVVSLERYAPSPRRAHCFFEWVYFSNVASTLDGRSVYLARKALGEELAELETVPADKDTIVVPVPDTSKAAADGMAYKLGVPCLEGLIRNRYTGRTFIEGGNRRKLKAQMKYTPLREVLEGKRVLLVEDSIVRSTTMRALLQKIREVGRPKEIHVRVASPPIIAPCFYGIDMSTISELFAPRFLQGPQMTDEVAAAMAKDLGADSLRYLPIDSLVRAIGLPPETLCQACITGQYPTPWGQKLYELALKESCLAGETRIIESVLASTGPLLAERGSFAAGEVSKGN